MKLLAIDTSTEACSVAVYADGDLYSRHELAPRKHAEQVLPWAEQLLDQAGLRPADLDAIAVGRGPGGFTGVRLAVAIAQGLAFALDKPLLPISSLAALAMQAEAQPGETVLAAIDARMGELYLGLFRRDAEGLMEPLAKEWMAPLSGLQLPAETIHHAVGSGLQAGQGVLTHQLGGTSTQIDAACFPHAEAIARLAVRDYARGVRVSPAELEPAYLRDKVAQTLVERGVKG